MPTSAETQATQPAAVTTAASPGDPFRYGWRYVRHERPDGSYEIEEVPLTLEDLLHPEEGDHVTHSEAHQRRCIYLYNMLQERIAADAQAVVLQDVRITWDVPELRPHGPDLMVIFGVHQRKNWRTFAVSVSRSDSIRLIGRPATCVMIRARAARVLLFGSKPS